MTDLKKKIGLLIRDARKAKGLTQKELGDLLGVSESAINKYEAGKVNASAEMLQSFAKALETTLVIHFGQ